MVNRTLRITYPRTIDGENRTPPATDLVISPYFPDFIGGTKGNFGVYCRRVGEDTLHHDETARIAIELWIFPPRAVESVVNGIQAVDLRWES